MLFLCTGNSARSQMAEALCEQLSGGAVRAASAGSHPKPLHPNAVRVMRERGIDIAGRRSKHLDEFAGRRFDYVISLCDRVREVCPEFPGGTRADPLEHPRPRARARQRRGDAARVRAHRRPSSRPASASSSPRSNAPRQEVTDTCLTSSSTSATWSTTSRTAVDFYTDHFGFTVRSSAAPAFADVVRGNLRLLLSGPTSSAGRPMPDGRTPEPGGWNRIHFIVDDIAAEVERLRAAGVTFRNDIVSGPGGQQILLEDPAGNPIELFQPAGT